MVHLADAPPQLGRVGGAVGLPVPAQGAPSRTPVRLAGEDLLAVEALEARAVRVHVDGHPVWLLGLLEIIRLTLSVGVVPALLAAPQGIAALIRQWDEAGLGMSGVKGSGVGQDGEGEEDAVEGHQGGGEVLLIALRVDVVN